MSDQMEHTEYRGHTVVDPQGQKLGEVTDVVFDETADEPRLMVVDPGKLSRSHFVPTEGAEAQGDAIVVPYDKDQVKSSPKASKDHVLSGHQIDAVEAHYGVQHA